jgi:outer membrane protein OmpA-like peptidoglycan-associated protein
MKNLTTLLLLVMSFTVSNTAAQKENEKLKEIFLDAEFFLLNEDYGDALLNYMNIYKRGYQENGNINYRIGLCYLNITGEKNKAISYLEKAVQYCSSKYQEGIFRQNYAPFDAYYYLGKAYRINVQLDMALKNYEKYKKYFENRDAVRTRLVNQEIAACNHAMEQMKKPVNIYPVRLGAPISTSDRDIAPVVSGDQNSMVYISKLRFYDALFFCHKINDQWSAPINITPEVQSDGDHYPTFLSYDGTELYLRKEDNFEADLMVSKKVNGVWTKAISLGKNINSKYWEGNMSLTKDGQTIYFSSNRKEGSGSMDIYKSVRQPDGEWGSAINLGSIINTPFNEDAPIISEDGKRLYFISQGHQTMGGYDIFYSNIAPDGQLSTPQNMGYPINTTDDDLYFFPVENGVKAYVSLDQPGNIGMEDIFEVHINPGAKLIAALESGKTDTTVIEQTIQPRPITPLLALVEEETTLQALVNPIENKDNEELENPIMLPVLFFDFNSAEITENSKKSLDYLITVYKNYNNIRIECTGHTDAIGSDKYNLILSEKRAFSAKNYLIGNGVNPASVLVKAKGEKEFIAINSNIDGTDNAEGRKFNRRVEIRIVDNKPDRKIVIEELNIPKNLKVQQP